MSEEMLVSYCSPTLSGLKTGSLFRVHVILKKMSGEISNFNQKLSKRNPNSSGTHIRQESFDLCLSSGKIKAGFLMRKCRRF